MAIATINPATGETVKSYAAYSDTEVDERIARDRGPAGQPGLQGVAHETACRGGSRRLRLVCRGRDKTVQSLHVPSPLPAHLLPHGVLPRPVPAAWRTRHFRPWRSPPS